MGARGRCQWRRRQFWPRARGDSRRPHRHPLRSHLHLWFRCLRCTIPFIRMCLHPLWPSRLRGQLPAPMRRRPIRPSTLVPDPLLLRLMRTRRIILAPRSPSIMASPIPSLRPDTDADCLREKMSDYCLARFKAEGKNLSYYTWYLLFPLLRQAGSSDRNCDGQSLH